MNRFARWTLPALLLCIAIGGIAACSDDDDPVAPGPTPPTSLAGTVGTAGGTLVSSDGRMTLVVPAGALAGDTEIRITEVVTAERRAPGGVPVSVFTTEPADLSFGQDVSVLLEGIPAPDPGTQLPGSVALIRGISSASYQYTAGEFAILDTDQWINEDTNSYEVTVFLGEFRNYLDIGTGYTGDGGAYVETSVNYDAGLPDTAMQGASFTATPRFTLSEHLSLDGDVTFFHRSHTGATPITPDETQISPSFLGTGPFGPEIWGAVLEFNAEFNPVAMMAFALQNAMAPDVEAIWPEPADRPIEVGQTTLLYDFAPTQVTLEPVVEPGDGWLATGLYDDIAVGTESGHAVPAHDTWSLGGSAVFTAPNGSVYRSLYEDSPLALLNNDLVYPAGAYWGGFPVGVGYPDVVEDSGWFFQYGQNGGEAIRWVVDGEFYGGGILLEQSASVTHGSAWDGGLVYTTELSNKVTFLSFDEAGNFSPIGTVTSFPGSTESPVAAAKIPNDTGAAIVLGGMDGSVWYADLGNLAAGVSKAGDLGDSPHDITFAGGLGFVSNRMSGTVSYLKTTPTLSVEGTYQTGSEPLGIASKVLPDGNVGVVTADWGSNTYTAARFMTDGTLIDRVTSDLPMENFDPVDVFYLPGDSKKYGIVGTSGYLFIGN